MLRRIAKLIGLTARKRNRRTTGGGRRRKSHRSLLSVARMHPGLLFGGGLALGIGIALAVAERGGQPMPRPTIPAAAQVAAAAVPQLGPPADAPLPASPSAAAPSHSPRPSPPMSASREGLPAHRPAWQQYAMSVPETGGRPIIAIVIDDMGIDKADSARVIGLPGPVTIAFMSYATELEAQARAARAAGHEVWLHVPMEPLDGELDAGPHALKTGLPPEENRRRLDWALARLDGYVGINNHMGSRFTSSEADMRPVLEEVKLRGLAFLDSRTTARTVAGRMAGELGIPHVDRDVFIDNDATVESVLIQLSRAERLAEKRGYALAIGHPHATTIEALLQWLPTLKEKGIVLVPASMLLRRPETATAG
jgi:uncharacterized protein